MSSIRRKIIPVSYLFNMGFDVSSDISEKYPKDKYSYAWSIIQKNSITKSAIDLSNKVEEHCGIRLFPFIKTIAVKCDVDKNPYKFVMYGENGAHYYFDFPRRYYNHNCYQLTEMVDPGGNLYISLMPVPGYVLPTKKTFRLRQKVEIISNIPHQLKNDKKPVIGTIVNIDGACYTIRPKSKRYLIELYENEIRPIQDRKTAK